MPRRQNIEKRSEEIKRRGGFDYWETKSTIGCRGSKQPLPVLTGRWTRMEIVLRLGDHTAASVVKVINGLERHFGKLFYKLRVSPLTMAVSFKISSRSIICNENYQHSPL